MRIKLIKMRINSSINYNDKLVIKLILSLVIFRMCLFVRKSNRNSRSKATSIILLHSFVWASKRVRSYLHWNDVISI